MISDTKNGNDKNKNNQKAILVIDRPSDMLSIDQICFSRFITMN